MTHRIFILNGEGGYYWPEALEGENLVGRSVHFCGRTHPILFQRENGVLVVNEKDRDSLFLLWLDMEMATLNNHYRRTVVNIWYGFSTTGYAAWMIGQTPPFHPIRIFGWAFVW